MRYGSICSGIEAASEAWHGLGWEPAFVAEVDPFPSAVLMARLGATRPKRLLPTDAALDPKERKTRELWAAACAKFPEGGSLPNLGDFTKIERNDYDGDIDLLVGGTPCQSFSIAGLRRGLADERGNLCLEFARLAYRTGARVAVWENVPGVLSSGSGRDFAAFLSLLCGWDVQVPRGGWLNSGIVANAPGCFGVAWRVLDAQYTRVPEFPGAVPQRRRRVILVGCLGSWEYPAEVLFDEELRGGDTPPRRKAWHTHSGDAEEGDSGAAFPCLPISSMDCLTRLQSDEGCTGIGTDRDPQYTITKNHHHAVCESSSGPAVVRRLMPVEAERLMGFRDGYTLVPWPPGSGRPCSDSCRFRALGNSMCVNVMAWVGHRIQEVEDRRNRQKRRIPSPESCKSPGRTA